MLDQHFKNQGYCLIPPSHYLNEKNQSSIYDLKKLFDLELVEDGTPYRKRAYMKLVWDRKDHTFFLAENQNYFQTATSNKKDGGKIRQFKTLDGNVLEIEIVQELIHKNLQMIREYSLLRDEANLIIGLHFIRYQTSAGQAAYSSPDWLHKDDEPLVFVHLVNLSKTALGGDNLIADDKSKTITHVFRLENDLDTLVVNKNVYHAVTPLGSRCGMAWRDVILFTIEPNYIQQ